MLSGKNSNETDVISSASHVEGGFAVCILELRISTILKKYGADRHLTSQDRVV